MDVRIQPEMSLEALLLRHHHSAAAASSLWTCLAVLAAFYIWRLRSLAVGETRKSAQHLSEPSPLQPLPEYSIPPPPATAAEDEGSQRPNECIPAVEESCRTCFTTKGILFEEPGWGFAKRDEDTEPEEERREDEEWRVAGGCGVVVYGGRSAGLDLGWYRLQDVAALNGNVVRLWEEEKRTAAFSAAQQRRRRRRRMEAE